LERIAVDPVEKIFNIAKLQLIAAILFIVVGFAPRAAAAPTLNVKPASVTFGRG